MTTPIEELPLEVDQNLIKNEIPFELIASRYPSLLSEWYPGYPCRPRRMNKNDPVPCSGYIKNGQVKLNNIFGSSLGLIELDKGEDLKEGEYQIWLQCKSGQYSIFIVCEI